MRLDDAPVNQAQLQIDESACFLAVKNANLTPARDGAEIGMSRAAIDAYFACMWRHGYVPAHKS